MFSRHILLVIRIITFGNGSILQIKVNQLRHFFQFSKQKKRDVRRILKSFYILAQDVAGASGAHSTDNQRQQLFATQPTSSTSKAASVASGSQILGGVQTTNSFHSVSSMDSSAEMSKYFPDAQTPSLSPFR